MKAKSTPEQEPYRVRALRCMQTGNKGPTHCSRSCKPIKTEFQSAQLTPKNGNKSLFNVCFFGGFSDTQVCILALTFPHFVGWQLQLLFHFIGSKATYYCKVEGKLCMFFRRVHGSQMKLDETEYSTTIDGWRLLDTVYTRDWREDNNIIVQTNIY